MTTKGRTKWQDKPSPIEDVQTASLSPLEYASREGTSTSSCPNGTTPKTTANFAHPATTIQPSEQTPPMAGFM